MRSPTPELIAHRAGNDLAALGRAQGVADTIELDVHRRRGAIEVRHAKVFWPTSRLWERWHWLPKDAPVPVLGEILAGAAVDTHLWLDLKGVDPRLATAVIEATTGHRPLTVSTKSWWLLRGFAGLDRVRRVRSAGNRLELFLVLRVRSRTKIDGVILHELLADETTVARLRQRALTVFTWGAESRDRVDQLVAWGVDGVILDDLDLLAELSSTRDP